MAGPYLAIIRYLLQRPDLALQFREAPPTFPSSDARALDHLLGRLLAQGAWMHQTNELLRELMDSPHADTYRAVARLIVDLGNTGEGELEFCDAMKMYRKFEEMFKVGLVTLHDTQHTPAPSVADQGFLRSYEWRELRMRVLKRDGAKCACCGATPANGAVMNVDHIKPRRTHPELALDPNNCQVLCETCNHGKGNWDATDWRGAEGK